MLGRVCLPQREGSALGFDEVKRNFGNIMEGLRRSSDRMDVEDMLADQVCFVSLLLLMFFSVVLGLLTAAHVESRRRPDDGIV